MRQDGMRCDVVDGDVVSSLCLLRVIFNLICAWRQFNLIGAQTASQFYCCTHHCCDCLLFLLPPCNHWLPFFFSPDTSVFIFFSTLFLRFVIVLWLFCDWPAVLFVANFCFRVSRTTTPKSKGSAPYWAHGVDAIAVRINESATTLTPVSALRRLTKINFDTYLIRHRSRLDVLFFFFFVMLGVEAPRSVPGRQDEFHFFHLCMQVTGR